MNFNTKMILKFLVYQNLFIKKNFMESAKKIFNNMSTKATKDDIDKLKISDKKIVVYDPIISPENINKSLSNNPTLKLKITILL